MKIARQFTTAGKDVFASVEWVDPNEPHHQRRRLGRVRDDRRRGAPASWSQLATDIMVSKYFRKAGVPQIDEHGTPMIVDDDGDGR